MRLSWLARNGRSPGEESLTAAVAVQAIEAKPAFGQIKPMRGEVLACTNSVLEMCQPAIGAHKKPRISSEGKENLSCRRAAPVVAEQTDDNADAATRRIVVGRGDQLAPSQRQRGLRCRGHARRPDIRADLNRATIDP